MPTITASIGIPVEMWQKCQQYRINRSAIARDAIAKEIQRVERETGGSRQANTPATTPGIQGAS